MKKTYAFTMRTIAAALAVLAADVASVGELLLLDEVDFGAADGAGLFCHGLSFLYIWMTCRAYHARGFLPLF